MGNRRQEIEAALAAWRDAERRLLGRRGAIEASIEAEIERHRSEFQRLSAEHMLEQMDALKEAEGRRSSATPSTEAFHQAAQDEKGIASEIWESARQSDSDTPQTRQSN